MQPPSSGEDRGDLDALRRRLYAAGSQDADLARYREALSAAGRPDRAEDRAATERPAAGRVRAPLRRRAALVVGAVAGAGALAGGAVLLLPPPRPGPVARPSSSPSPPQQVLRLAAGAAAGFRTALGDGGSAGLQRYLYAHPTSLPSALSGITRAFSEEWASAGPGAITLHPTPTALRGGRVTLVLVLDRSDSALWSLSRTAVRQNHEQYRQVVADGVLRTPAGAPAAVTLDYGAAAPTFLGIEVPPGVRWGAVVAFTD